jgi:hypothetical protein
MIATIDPHPFFLNKTKPIPGRLLFQDEANARPPRFPKTKPTRVGGIEKNEAKTRTNPGRLSSVFPGLVRKSWAASEAKDGLAL